MDKVSLLPDKHSGNDSFAKPATEVMEDIVLCGILRRRRIQRHGYKTLNS